MYQQAQFSSENNALILALPTVCTRTLIYSCLRRRSSSKLSPPINDTMSVNSDEVEPFVNRWQRRFTDSERRLVLSAKIDKYCVNAS